LRRIEQQLQQLEQHEARIKEQQKATARLSKRSAPINTPQNNNDVDWLKTRRHVLRAKELLPAGKSSNDGTVDAAAATGTTATTGADGDLIPVRMYTLLSKDEIVTCLQTAGQIHDVTVILDDPRRRRMGGAVGMIIATGATHIQICTAADALVRQMRLRGLHERNVMGAQYGPEGSRHASVDESWLVVDCRNYVVHLQDEKTRRLVNLESIWTGKDPLHQLNPMDENEVEDYVASHPVPEEYGRSVFELDDTLKQLQKSRYTSPHRPVVPRKVAKKKRKS